MATPTRGTRSLLALAALSATAIAGIVSAPTPAQSVVAGDCAQPFPVADLVADQAVNGLTVSRGTTPDAFTGTVLGVLKDGINPGVDMIMMRLTNPEIDRVGGIWAGMSGSPVYAEDGRLIGAVAYGLSFGPSTVAGVTPFEAMDDYLAPAPPVVEIGPGVAQTIARESDVTAAQASEGFTQLRMPLAVAGAGKKLDGGKNRPYAKRATAGGGSVGAAVAGPEDIVAGGNLSLTASTGDITLAGTGTATSVCDDQVVGFGHPATFRGKIQAGMNPADAIYVQEDPVFGPYKVANIGPTVGTITDDHLTGITGTFGAAPTGMDVSSTVTYGSRSRSGASEVLLEDYQPDVVFYQLLANHDTVLDGRIPGTAENTWVIEGHKPDGTPFTIDLGNRYTDSDVVLYSSIWDIPDMVWLLGRMDGVTLDSVSATSDVTDDTGTWKVKSAEYKKGSTWVPLKGLRSRIQVKAGSTLKVRVLIKNGAGVTVKVPTTVAIPKSAKNTRGHLHVSGGAGIGNRLWGTRNIDQFLKRVDSYIRNDQVVAYIHGSGRGKFYERTEASAPADQVIQGQKTFTLIVK